jgi:nicotinamidase/pyrazinamidase
MDNTAILRVDLQWAFTPEGWLPTKSGREVVPGVNRVTQEARDKGLLIIDTVDLHPENHISFASRWSLPPFSQNPLNPSNPADLLWTDHGMRWKDIELIEGIIDPADCVKIYKWWMRNRDAYSGFDMWVTKLLGNPKDGYEIAPWAKTLKEVLIQNNIRILKIFWLVTEVCVKQNILNALEEWFDVEVIKSATRGLTPEWHQSTLQYLASLDGKPNRQGRIQSVKILP